MNTSIPPMGVVLIRPIRDTEQLLAELHECGSDQDKRTKFVESLRAHERSQLLEQKLTEVDREFISNFEDSSWR